MTPAPASKLKLEWVYGYRGRDARVNLHLLPTGEMTYFVAAVVVSSLSLYTNHPVLTSAFTKNLYFQLDTVKFREVLVTPLTMPLSRCCTTWRTRPSGTTSATPRYCTVLYCTVL